MSGKTVAEKLHLKGGKKVTFFNEPDDNRELLGGIPESVIITKEEPADIVLAYIENFSQLRTNLAKLKSSIVPEGALWIAYHKGSSSIETDINRDSIIEFASGHNLKGVAMISINEDWSALRLKITS